MSDIPATQQAIQIVGVDEFVLNPAKPVDEVGPHQMLLKVEACGICFSDTKLLHAFDSHPRKAEVISGIAPEALTEIPGYRPGGQATVLSLERSRPSTTWVPVGSTSLSSFFASGCCGLFSSAFGAGFCAGGSAGVFPPLSLPPQAATPKATVMAKERLVSFMVESRI